MVRNLIEEVGTCVTRLEFQQSQHWPANVNKVCGQWTLLVERDPPLDTDAISMKFDCAI
jgi:NADH pyrophosphatase NudC (nudix superfamily)